MLGISVSWDVVILQEGVIKESLYLDTGSKSRKKDKEEKEGDREKRVQEDWRKSLYISISTREKWETHKANEQERRGHDYY